MNSDGTRDARGTHANPVPRPAPPLEGTAAPQGGPAVPPLPAMPPRPAHTPGGDRPGVPPRSAVAAWLDESRPAAEPGIWRYGYRLPKGARTAGRLSPTTMAGMLIPLVVGLIIWSLWIRGLIPYQWAVLRLITPNGWWWAGTEVYPKTDRAAHAVLAYRGAAFVLLCCAMGRLGSWGKALRYFLDRVPQPRRAVITALGALVAVGWVFPSAFPGAFWGAAPVFDTVGDLVIALSGDLHLFTSVLFVYSLYAVITAVVVWPFARLGDWLPYARQLRAARTGDSVTPAAERPRAQWPELHEAGLHEAADVLSTEVAGGRMNDVDCARVTRAWAAAKRDATLAAFRDTVLHQGGAAWTHPSGERDLPRRRARHDLLVGQVRIGRWVAAERVPQAYQDMGAALGPQELGTSLLAVGPSGSGKTRQLVEPVTEALALQALTGECAVVAVSAPGAPLGADAAFDVIVRIGDPASVHDLDPYAETEDPDEAAAVLAEGLVGDLETVGSRHAATALAQVLGPYRAVHGRFPPLPELRELLEGEPSAVSALRTALADGGHATMRRELEARIRQTGGSDDVGRALADRLALLNRPVFAEFFGAGGGTRPFSLRAVAHHPLRVRIDLPEQGHEEASRLLTRLILAQFTAVVRSGRRTHFACLVLDDATGALTAESVRRIQRLRSQNAGVVLALRSIGDVPEALHGPLYGAVGCRMAFSGVTTWDGSRFAQSWGTEWVETRDVSQHTVFADQPMTRAMHSLRKLVTGKAVTTEAVTVRQVERERWSASELAHGVPPGHAVLSLTTVRGEHAPPLLVDLRG
ncbi:ATP/GTP-binding protein [Streptomyces sp. NK08204]|uniref:ATP/GTP-binding protein n=1 Tax=Streptomyces sp. NK08204 TaxID=2873260 RepID=UPI001CECDFDF|nr:ATP/GTP-binding protein [Streptomyces sp. NK08204]